MERCEFCGVPLRDHQISNCPLSTSNPQIIPQADLVEPNAFSYAMGVQCFKDLILSLQRSAEILRHVGLYEDAKSIDEIAEYAGRIQRKLEVRARGLLEDL